MSGLDVKTIAIGAIIGLIIGGGIGYLSTQPEINTLKENLATQEAAVNSLEANLQESKSQLSTTRSNLSQLETQLQEALDEKTAAQVELDSYKAFYQEMWDEYNELIQSYNSLQGATPVGEMVTTPIPGVINGNFDDNSGWVLQGVGGIGWSAAYLDRADSFSTFLSQTVTIDQKDLGVQFDVKPEPGDGTLTLQVFFGGYLIFEESYAGQNTDYVTKTIPLKPLLETLDRYNLSSEGQFALRFSIAPGTQDGAKVIIDTVTLVNITYQPSEPSTH